MKRLFFIKLTLTISVAFLLFLITGCWNRKELNDLGIVGAVSIDQETDKIKLTYEIIMPRRIDNKGADSEAATFFESEGASIFDAIRNGTLTYDKKLYWPHLNVLFFNEESSKEGLQQYLDLFNRDHDLRKYINLFVVKGSPASEMMDHEWKKGGVPSEYIEVMAENYVSNGKTVSIKLMDFIRAYYAEGIEPVVGSIEISKKMDKPKEEKEDKEDKEAKENEEYMPLIEGVYVFKDDKLIGYLDGFKTRGFNFVKNKIESCIIVSESSDQQGINSVEILESSCEMDIQRQGDKYVGSVSIEVTGMLGEATGDADISTIQAIKQIEQKTSDVIKNEVEDSIKKVQEYQSDIFGFGQLIHQKYPKEWRAMKENWNEQFSSLKVDVTVKTNIVRAGKANEPLFVKTEE